MVIIDSSIHILKKLDLESPSKLVPRVPRPIFLTIGHVQDNIGFLAGGFILVFCKNYIFDERVFCHPFKVCDILGKIGRK